MYSNYWHENLICRYFIKYIAGGGRTMRVVGLVSSPRRGGNSELAVKEVLSRFPDDWEKTMIRLNELNINLCKACYGCLPEGTKCKVSDDLDFLVRHISMRIRWL